MDNEPKFWEAEDAYDLLTQHVIPEWHGDLADFTFRCVFQRGLTKNQRMALATIQKLSGKQNYFVGADVLVMVNADMWPDLNPEQKKALLDHECCHLRVEEGRDGNPVLKTVGHDLEEFGAVVRRHGAWWPDIEEFSAQMKLPLDMSA